MTDLRLQLRRRVLAREKSGPVEWRTQLEPRSVPAARSAMLLCDVWDRHWCRGAEQRLDRLLPRIDEVTRAARAAGMLVVHAPSETMPFYAETPARRRAQEAPPVALPELQPHDDPPLPIDDSDGGCDTWGDKLHTPWTRQHPAIGIDQERDVISDNGDEIYNVYQQHGITTVFIMGVHVNMCVLRRSFAIKALVRRGIDVVLVRDLTDSMYNPASRPYVSHDEGTHLVVAYIEAFWCPTVASDEFLGAIRLATGGAG
jgi:nicotinamidase-related amidase